MTGEPRVDAYIAEAQPFARPILEKVRARVHAVIPEAQETLKWSMPAYVVDGKIVLITAAFKTHAALNFWRGKELRGDEANANAMGQFGRLKSIGDLPADAELDRLIREAGELARSSRSARKPEGTRREAPEIHPEFAAALATAPRAKAVLDGFSPSAQREYLEWIADAKRNETRQKRIATAISWLSDGKKRNWQYER